MMMMSRTNLPYREMIMVMILMTNLPYREAPPGTTDYSATPAEPWQQHHHDDIYDYIDNRGHHLH